MNEIREFTFLKEEEVFGDSQLEVLKKYGNRAAITDFAIISGGYVSSSHYLSNDKAPEYRTGSYYLATPGGANDLVPIIGTRGERGYVETTSTDVAIRPVSVYSDNAIIKKDKDNVTWINYGEYPQTAVDERISKVLEDEYNSKMLKETGKKFTVESAKIVNGFTKNPTYTEYEYNSKKYIRFVYMFNEKKELSDGRTINANETIWIKIEPVEWLLDEKTKIIIAKKCLISGTRYTSKDYYDGDFNKTEIKKFLNYHFAYELLNKPSDKQTNTAEKADNTNPFDFDFSRVSEEDIVRGSIESGISVFLHGLPSEGKSARVKQLDPDAEVVYLRNATPDSLNGKSVYNQETHEMIDVPPTWYRKIKENCEKEPDKIHIVFFDEITNALPAIQGMAYNIVLNREVNGMWKLPDNARVVAAGNEYSDSLAANQIAEPLFNRFVHVYIETSIEDWLKWAITVDKGYNKLPYDGRKQEHTIHPAIYTYIAFKREQALRTPYTGERPNADPRKWELASALLYKTRKPEMLRGLVGHDITRDFVRFCTINLITLEDVLNDDYDAEDLEMNTDEKWATVVGLTYTSEENIEKVRNFVHKLEGAELIEVFDSIWVHGDKNRTGKIEELKKADKKSKIRRKK